MSNILVFPVEHLVEAHYAALDPASDLVIVRNLADPSDRDYLKHRTKVLDRMNTLTPLMEEWWRSRDVLVDESDCLEQRAIGIVQYEIGLHIDAVPLIGYIASANLGDTPRSFYASRQGVPSFATPEGIDHTARLVYSKEIKDGPVPTDEWALIRPGDAALFGALPNLAKHAAEGDTQQVVLATWQIKSNYKMLQ